jgi:hypothetical protein
MGEIIEIGSTKSQLEEFKESLIWKDISREIETWLDGLKVEQDNIVRDAEDGNPSTASVLLHLGDINGRRKAMQYILGIPDVLIGVLETRNISSNDEPEEVSDEHDE